MTIRNADRSDLGAINQVITDAVMAWPLPERARRLIVPVLCYNDGEDLDYYQALVWEEDGQIVGVATWDITRQINTAKGRAKLLHGLFIAPGFQRRGIGQTLIGEVAVRAAASDASLDGLLIKAERVAIGFFEHCGLEQIKAVAPEDYPYQFWRPLD